MLLAGMPAAMAAAIMAPVEVPPTNEKISRAGRPVVASSLARATAGMMPRMPPPSMVNKHFRGILSPFHRFPRWLTPPHLATLDGGDESAMNFRRDLAWHLTR